MINTLAKMPQALRDALCADPLWRSTAVSRFATPVAHAHGREESTAPLLGVLVKWNSSRPLYFFWPVLALTKPPAFPDTELVPGNSAQRFTIKEARLLVSGRALRAYMSAQADMGAKITPRFSTAAIRLVVPVRSVAEVCAAHTQCSACPLADVCPPQELYVGQLAGIKVSPHHLLKKLHRGKNDAAPNTLKREGELVQSIGALLGTVRPITSRERAIWFPHMVKEADDLTCSTHPL